MASSEPSNLVKQLEAATKNPPQDPILRKQLYQASKKLFIAVEDQFDTIYRINYSAQIISVAKVAIDLKIFEILVKAKGPVSTSELAKTTKASDVLLGRILRFLASHDMVVEADEDSWTANNVAQVLSIAGFQAGLNHSFETLMPCLQHTPQFLADTGYINPADVVHSPFQLAHKTDVPAFVWAMGQPKLVADFQLWMSVLHESQKTFLDVIDFERLCRHAASDTVVFVDIGGGLGQQCALLKGRLPHLKGRVILQELSMVLPHAMQTPGVENTELDFWTGQPVKGARTYYMRNILHDYPDDKVLTLLKNTIAAMGSESVILVDEMVIPNKGAHPRALELDITMLTSLASMERTEKQWHALLAAAGLRIRESGTYNDATGESVMVLVPV
ncbi:MAG: hypothetical protein M1821_009069 [Bathelium mastoideum]|nr:MAG: hypothetical protein M1821_009069 [Bathelium mastoideum]